MPSLRRSVSSPLVRASPYPAASALAVVNRPRRANSGAEPLRRRVLADIEWWRVLDGQQEEPEPDADVEAVPTADQSAEANQGADMDHDALRALGPAETDADAMRQIVLRPSTPANELALGDVDSATEVRAHIKPNVPKHKKANTHPRQASSLMTPFAALSISALAPSTPPRTRHARQEASDASTDSSPDTSPRADAAAFAFHDGALALALLESRLADADAPPPSFLARPGAPLHALRSISWSGFDAPRGPVDDRFGDVVFL